MSTQYKQDPDKQEEKKQTIYDIIDESMQGMIKEKQENPDLFIPYSLLDFYNTPEMVDLIITANEYVKTLITVNTTLSMLKQEGKHAEATIYRDKHSSILPELGRSLAKKYGQIILKLKGAINSVEDQSFYETVIYFIIRVIKTGINPDYNMIIEEELNRLFRSTAFNIFQRRITELERMKKNPYLKPPVKRDIESIISNIIMRNNYSKLEKKTYSFNSLTRPAYYKLSPYKAITSRSPLISLLLPSPKDKIREFEEKRRKKIRENQKLPGLTYNKTSLA